MSRPGRRAALMFGLGAAVGIASGIVWPGDPAGEPFTVAHRVAVGGFLVTAALLMVGAGLLFIAVLGGAWKVKNFDLNEYLERMKRHR